MLDHRWFHRQLAEFKLLGSGQVDKVDLSRAGRYVERLKELQQSRSQIQSRAATLLTQNPDLESEFIGALRTQLITAGALEETPALWPRLTRANVWHLSRPSWRVALQPQLLMWYFLQDNTHPPAAFLYIGQRSVRGEIDRTWPFKTHG